MALLLYSLIVLWFAQVGVHCYKPPDRPWYTKKAHPSFFDMRTTLRRETLRAEILGNPGTHRPSEKIIHLIQIATESSA
jgi:hypothetical protein